MDSGVVWEGCTGEEMEAGMPECGWEERDWAREGMVEKEDLDLEPADLGEVEGGGGAVEGGGTFSRSSGPGEGQGDVSKISSTLSSGRPSSSPL
jgi:hypothetical protein